MDSHEFYFLVMVLAAFGIFAVSLGGSYLKYMGWKDHHPQAGD